VQETERGLPRRGQLRPVAARGVEEAECADDVGLDERLGGIDRAVDVRLGREVHDRVDLVLREEAGDEFRVADAAVGENIARVRREVCEIRRVAGVGERVEVDDSPQKRI